MSNMPATRITTKPTATAGTVVGKRN